jgi:hypothetical protein
MENEEKEKLTLKDWLTDADRKFYHGTLFNSLLDYRDYYKLDYDKNIVAFLDSSDYIESEELNSEDETTIVRGISGYEALETWLFKDVSYVKRENELNKLINEGKDKISELLSKREKGEDVQGLLDEASKKQASLQLELSNINIDNTFFRREKLYEKVDLALSFMLDSFKDNSTLVEIARQIKEHIKDRSGYMQDEIKLKKELEEAIANGDEENIKLKSAEIENRRAARRRDMLTLGTCTVVKTNQ